VRGCKVEGEDAGGGGNIFLSEMSRIVNLIWDESSDLCLAGCNESRFSYLLPSNLGLIYYLGSHIFFTSNLSLIFYIGKNLHNFKLRFNLLSRFLYRLHFKPRFNLFSRFSYLLHFKPKFNLLYRFVYLYNLKPRFNLFLGFYHRGSHNFRSWIACIIYSWLPQRIRL